MALKEFWVTARIRVRSYNGAEAAEMTRAAMEEYNFENGPAWKEFLETRIDKVEEVEGA